MELPQTLVYHIIDDKYHFIQLEPAIISVHFDLKPHLKAMIYIFLSFDFPKGHPGGQ